ncbi:MAG: YkoF family thiamine/hydroxymethylpyrimidine-binding protein, partial [Pseudomonadota bacterium]
ATAGKSASASIGVLENNNMQARMDVSLYPLANDYIPAIKDVIQRFNSYPALVVVTNEMSTQITGELDVLMQAMQREIRTSFEQHGKCIFVMKLLPL